MTKNDMSGQSNPRECGFCDLPARMSAHFLDVKSDRVKSFNVPCCKRHFKMSLVARWGEEVLQN